MAFTIEQIDAKVAVAQAEVAAAEEALAYWKSVREVVGNPRFAELEAMAPVLPHHGVRISTPIQIESGILQIEDGIPPPRKKGEMKRLALECLPYDGDGLTPQQLAERIAAAGFEFRTKTPYISVNEALQALKAEGKVRFMGRLLHNNAGLWLRLAEATPKFYGGSMTEVSPQ